MDDQRRLVRPWQPAQIDTLRSIGVETTYWNGEPTPARKVTLKVAADTRYPHYWANHLVGTMRKAVEVTYNGQVFYLDDDHGQGWNKVLAGGGPEWGHAELRPDGEVVERG